MHRRWLAPLAALRCRCAASRALPHAWHSAPHVLQASAVAVGVCSPFAAPAAARHEARRWHSDQAKDTAEQTGDEAMTFDFDPMASVRHDAAVESAKKNAEALMQTLLPAQAPPSAFTKLRKYLQQHPIDGLIICSEVQITHVENKETGKEEKVNLSPCATAEALEQARERNMNLVQMGNRGELAFCRIRDERPWVMKLVQEDLEAATAAATAAAAAPTSAAGGGGGAAAGQTGRPHKTRPLIDHTFRDAVDAHFIGWRSKRICQDLRKGHPVKLTIKDFQSAEAAILKLREMCNAMKQYAEAEKIYHYFTSIVANDHEASITFSPAAANKSGTVSHTVKHPGEKEWAHSLRRMEEMCRKVGRAGTYAKSNKLKPRNVGVTTYRVDKYGRRVD